MKYLIGFLFIALTACAAAEPSAPVSVEGPIYWSDGDSGRLGDMKFRLANVDAPETGGVGAFGGAKCEAERALGYDAKAFVLEMTRDADLIITERFGLDRYDREVIYLSADGVDVGEAGIAAGHLGAWPHKGRRALADKPDWCAIAGKAK